MSGFEVGLILAGTAALAGATTGIIAQTRQSRAQADIATRNAEQQAQDVEQQALLLDREAGSLDVQRAQDAMVLERNLEIFDERVADFEGQETAAIGASGFEFTGSPILVAMENARRNARNRANLEFEAELEDRRLADQTGLISFQAGEARRRGRVLPSLGRFEAGNIRQAGLLSSLAIGLGGASRAGGVLMQLPGRPTPTPVVTAGTGAGFAPGLSFT